jgi:hypothetical protein
MKTRIETTILVRVRCRQTLPRSGIHENKDRNLPPETLTDLEIQGRGAASMKTRIET